jgi:LPS export ABC transporter protein LptC
MRPITLLAVGACLLFNLAGCSLDLTTSGTTNPDDIPLLVMEDFVQTTSQEGRKLYSVQGQRYENFNARQEIRLKEFTFQEYDSEGKVASEGRAEKATIKTQSNDARVEGTLQAKSAKQGVALSVEGGASGGVDWNNDEKRMSTVEGSRVSLSKDDGSRISAQGMVLSLKTNELVLEKAVTGLWKAETKNDETTISPATPAASPAASSPP